jgi:nucleoid-associated protein YgaU
MPSLEQATITNTITNQRITVQFNPEEYTLSQGVNYAQAAISGLSAPLLQFAHGEMQTLEMELLVDTYEAHRTSGGATGAGDDVRTVVTKLTDLMTIDPSTHAPPVLLFTWASLSFTCVLAKVSQKFIMFLPNGVPVRARLQVTLNEFSNADLEPKEIKRETANYTKQYIVSQNESISAIAGRVYNDATNWRPIAIHNAIDDPRKLAVGQRLLIPLLPFIDPDTGEVMS